MTQPGSKPLFLSGVVVLGSVTLCSWHPLSFWPLLLPHWISLITSCLPVCSLCLYPTWILPWMSGQMAMTALPLWVLQHACRNPGIPPRCSNRLTSCWRMLQMMYLGHVCWLSQLRNLVHGSMPSLCHHWAWGWMTIPSGVLLAYAWVLLCPVPMPVGIAVWMWISVAVQQGNTAAIMGTLDG